MMIMVSRFYSSAGSGVSGGVMLPLHAHRNVWQFKAMEGQHLKAFQDVYAFSDTA